MIDYDEHRVVEKELVRLDDCIPFKDAQTVTWINVDSATEPGLLENFGRVMGFHALMLEDILNTDQRPKFEDYGSHIYMVAKMLDFDIQKGGIQIEQISIILGENYLISFGEHAGDFFDPLRERIRKSLGLEEPLLTQFFIWFKGVVTEAYKRYFSNPSLLTD